MMGFLRKDTLPKPNPEAMDKARIEQLEAELRSMRQTGEAQSKVTPIQEPLLPPKYEGAGKYMGGEKQPTDEPKIEHKIEYVPVSHEELIQIQLDRIQQDINEILERLKR